MNSLKLIVLSISLILSFSLIEANISDVPPDENQIDPIKVTYPQLIQGPGKGRGWFRRAFRKIKDGIGNAWKFLTGKKASWKIECNPLKDKNCCWPWQFRCIRNGK
ncbi:hypothetical protein SNEBB_006032 [Seison nebaliae]|nr:hypothetical protein SNEBB_006032 [Seison nebaliae]